MPPIARVTRKIFYKSKKKILVSLGTPIFSSYDDLATGMASISDILESMNENSPDLIF